MNITKNIADKIIQELVAIDMGKSSVMISMPVLYPSGSTVVVKVDSIRNNYFVSDMGLGFQEAEMMGAVIMFKNAARTISDNTGVGFDEHAFFITQASRDQLIGAIISVASCSSEATVITAHKLTEKTQSDNSDILYNRLVSIFDQRRVHRHVEYKGASQTTWDVDLVVNDRETEILFEAVTKHPNSFAATVTKYVDISNLEFPPKRIAVVNNKKDFGTKLEVLSRTADVIESKIPDIKIKEMSQAA